MVGIAQLVRAPLCGRGGRRFESGYPPHNTSIFNIVRIIKINSIKIYLIIKSYSNMFISLPLYPDPYIILFQIQSL